MTKTVILVLLVFAAYGVSVHEGVGLRHKQHPLEELNKSEWGKTIVEMLALHAQSQGPVDELVQLVQDLIQDVTDELQELQHEFNIRTNEHNSEVTNLELQIQNAVIDIQRTDDTLENLLKPRRSQVRNKIKQLQEYQEANKKKKKEVILVREQEANEYASQQADYSSALAAVDQALNLLGSLSNPSLVEVQKFHMSLRKVESKINPHTEQGTLIKALIALANEQNFSDQNIIRQIIDRMNEFRNSVVDAVNDLSARENERIAEFEQRIVQLDAEHAEFGRQIINQNIDLTALTDKINELNGFIAQRDNDRKTYQAQLDLENQSYAEEAQIFTDKKNNSLRELEIAEQGKQLLSSADLKGINIMH